MDKLKVCIELYKADIVCITESKLNADIFDAEVSIENFTLYRLDRNFKGGELTDEFKTGGGSLIYVRNTIYQS